MFTVSMRFVNLLKGSRQWTFVLPGSEKRAVESGSNTEDGEAGNSLLAQSFNHKVAPGPECQSSMRFVVTSLFLSILVPPSWLLLSTFLSLFTCMCVLLLVLKFHLCSKSLRCYVSLGRPIVPWLKHSFVTAAVRVFGSDLTSGHCLCVRYLFESDIFSGYSSFLSLL